MRAGDLIRAGPQTLGQPQCKQILGAGYVCYKALCDARSHVALYVSPRERFSTAPHHESTWVRVSSTLRVAKVSNAMFRSRVVVRST